MPLYYASFTNVYSYPKKELPALEGETPKLKCYAICSDNNFDKYTGTVVSPKDESALVGTLSGAGEQTGTSAVGVEMSSGDEFTEWCDAPTAADPFKNAGYVTDHSYGILYIDKPELQGLVGADAPHDRATMNAIRKALRNAGKLIDVEADFPDLAIDDRFWHVTPIAAMQQWIIDNCGKFAHPDRITDAANMRKNQVVDDPPSGTGDLTIQHKAWNHDTNAWYYFCMEIAALKTGVKFGWSYADTADASGPVAGRDGLPGDLPAGDRVCEENDYVLTLQLKEIATALEYLHGAPTTFNWTANGKSNWVEGESDEDSEFYTFGEAQDEAELSATDDTYDGSPSQESQGGYTPDNSESSSSSSSSTGDPGSESSSDSSSSSSSADSSSIDSSLDSSIDSDPGSSEDSAGWSSEWFSDFYSDWWSDNF